MANTTSSDASNSNKNLPQSKSKSVLHPNQDTPFSDEELLERKKERLLAWAYREAVRTDFLKTKDEISCYMAALYGAAMWGETIR